jgi:hypothetical protein
MHRRVCRVVIAVALLLVAVFASSAQARSLCPASHRTAVVSARPGASASLVPAGARTVIVCRYNGLPNPPPLSTPGYPSFGLIAARTVTSAARVAHLAAELDAIPQSNSTLPLACPADVGTAIVAYFHYPSGRDDPVTVDLTGCQNVSNGHVNRLALNARVVGQLKSLVPIPRPATIKGKVELCGGAGPDSACRVAPFSYCPTASLHCATSDRATVRTASGRLVAQARLHDGRFTVRVPPGSYVISVLADGGTVHGHVLESTRLKVRARARATVTFIFNVK